MKKGALSTRELVLFIVFAASLAVILLFFGYYPWTGTIDKEACKQSVVMRSTFNYGAFEPGKEIIPLNCKTEKICLAMGGDCENEFGEPSRKNPVTEVKLSGDKVEIREEIKEVLANAMYDCHSMLGEGKLNFMPSSTFKQNYCLICSRVVFDEDVKREVESIGYGELYEYLEKKKTPGGKSYLEYLHPGWTNWEASEKLFENMQEASDNEEFKKLKFEDWKINLNFDNGHVIVAQMSPAENFWGKALAVGTFAGGVLLTVKGVAITATGIGAPAGVSMVVAGIGIAGTTVASGAVIWQTHQGDAGFDYAPPTIFPYDAETLNSLRCSSFETAP